jgi:hypothetical protein
VHGRSIQDSPRPIDFSHSESTNQARQMDLLTNTRTLGFFLLTTRMPDGGVEVLSEALKVVRQSACGRADPQAATVNHWIL